MRQSVRVRVGLEVSAVMVAAGLMAGCQERLTAPADCPDFCPGHYDVRDTLLAPVFGGDTAFEGYLVAGQGVSLRVSDRLPISEDRAVIRFAPRGDSVQTDSLRPYIIDSVQIGISILYRDTLVSNPVVYLYRLPADVDTTTSFAVVDGAFSAASLIDSFVVADSEVAPRLTTVLRDSAGLARVAIPAADSGVLAIGVKLVAPSPTGIRIGSAAAGSSGPIFTTFVRTIGPDTTRPATTITRLPRYNAFVSQNPPPLDPDLLTIGGVPSSRSIIRFPFTGLLADSVTILRATLQLVPTGPIDGLTGDPPVLDVRPVLADFGAKSPIGVTVFSQQEMTLGSADTVSAEVVRLVRLWQSSSSAPTPPAVFIGLVPEVSNFSRVTFGSSRAGLQPVLRVTYARNYPFENP